MTCYLKFGFHKCQSIISFIKSHKNYTVGLILSIHTLRFFYIHKLILYSPLLEKTALQNFTSEVNFIKGVPICKVTFVLTLQKVKVQRLPLQTLKYN